MVCSVNNMPMKKNKLFVPQMPEERLKTLTMLRNRKMARSPHAYVRGNTERFYDWLNANAISSIPAGPSIWICGDCHLGNLGPVADSSGKVRIQIRDLDQTVIGNPAHDLIRLGLSLASAARGSNLSGKVTSSMLEQLIVGYLSAFSVDHAEPVRVPKPDPVRVVLKQAIDRSFRHLCKERMEGKRNRIPRGRRFWHASDEEQEEIRRICELPEIHALVTSLKCRSDDAHVSLLDAAYWVKGCSSLGKLRFAALLEIHGQSDDDSDSDSDFCLIDIKEAVRALAPRDRNSTMPHGDAERVVAGAQALAPFLGSRMLPDRVTGHSVFIRELLPQDLKIDIESLDEAQADVVALYLASVVGRAHASQLDLQTQERWAAELQRNHSRGLDAPSWLWRSIVDLLGSHEIGYLEHCRRQSALEDLDRRRHKANV